MIRTPDVDTYIASLEPALETAMHYHVTAGPEQFRLRGSMCFFASRVLQEVLRPRHETDICIGAPFDEPDMVPSRMRRHVVLRSPEVTLDATYSQWLALVGVDPILANQYPDIAQLYPARRVAVIPRGNEKQFGERFADFALDTASKMSELRRTLGLVSIAGGWSTDDVCNWMPKEGAFSMLSGIWEPDRYQPFDHQNEAEVLVQQAAAEVRDTVTTATDS